MCPVTSLPAGAAELYGLAPTEFVAGRNAMVKALKRAKQADDATIVAALRRPSLADHAVNAAARADPGLAQRWAAAVVAVAEAQSSAIGGGTAGALRDTTANLRAETGHLVDAAVAAIGDETKRNDVLAALRAATTRPGAALVATGILGAADPDDELFAGAPEPSGPVPGRGRARAAPDTDGRADAQDTDGGADAPDTDGGADAPDSSGGADAPATRRGSPAQGSRTDVEARGRAGSQQAPGRAPSRRRHGASGPSASRGGERGLRAQSVDGDDAPQRHAEPAVAIAEAVRTAAAERSSAAQRAAERLAAAGAAEAETRARLDAARRAVDAARDALRAAEAGMLAAQRDVRSAAAQTAAAKKTAARAGRR